MLAARANKPSNTKGPTLKASPKKASREAPLDPMGDIGIIGKILSD